jgi:hypothetical protein
MSKELQVPHMMMHRILHKWLHLFAYKVHIVHELKPDGKPYQQNCTMRILHQNSLNPVFLLSVLFSDEAVFLQWRKSVGSTYAYGAQKITAFKSSPG